MILDLVPGYEYVRASLHDEIKGQRFGGISTPADYPLVLLFTGEQGALYGYDDGFQEDGTYLYTGEGQTGDMQLTRGNRAIRYHQESGKELHLFQYVRTAVVQYVGQAYYIDHFTRIAQDRDKVLRSAIVFELAVEPSSDGVADRNPVEISKKKPPHWSSTLSKLREAAYTASTKDVPAAQRKSTVHYRSEIVKTYVLRRAQGICEGCNTEAPFITPQGIPYLEPHHLRRRADKGPDHPEWVIALCPNCHRRVHYGHDGREYNEYLGHCALNIEAAISDGAVKIA